MAKNGVLYGVIALCVLLFALEALGMTPSLNERGALWALSNPNYAPYQWLSHMFLHGSAPHLLFNMYALWLFGRPLLIIWSVRRFVVVFLISGLAGAVLMEVWGIYIIKSETVALLASGVDKVALAQMLDAGVLYQNMVGFEHWQALMRAYYLNLVGASGAIFGLMAAFAVWLPRVPFQFFFIPIPIEARFLIPILVGYEIVAQVTGWSIFGDNIAHLAHIGGAIVGALLAWFYLPKKGVVGDFRL